MFTLVAMIWGSPVVIPGFTTAPLARAAIAALGLEVGAYYVVQVS